MSEKPEPPSVHTGKWIAIYPDGSQEGVITSGGSIEVGDALPNGTILEKWDYGETERRVGCRRRLARSTVTSDSLH